MGYISAFGTRHAALIVALAVSGAQGIAATSPTELDVSITGLRSTKGNILACVTANPKAFPDCSRDPAAHRLTIAAAQASTLRFSGVAPGTYAISIIHDENGNGKLDTRFMIPREGFGFSRNPVITFGPPRFESAGFAVNAEGGAQTVRIKYML